MDKVKESIAINKEDEHSHELNMAETGAECWGGSNPYLNGCRIYGCGGKYPNYRGCWAEAESKCGRPVYKLEGFGMI